jgi:hypothetical protein
MLGGISFLMFVCYLTLRSIGKFHMGITDCKLTKYEGGALLAWYWQVNTGVLWETPVSTPLRPPQYPHALARDRIRTSAARDRRLTVRLRWHDLRWYAHIYGKGQEKIAKISFSVIFFWTRREPSSYRTWGNSRCAQSSVLIIFRCYFMYLFILSKLPVTTACDVRKFTGITLDLTRRSAVCRTVFTNCDVLLFVEPANNPVRLFQQNLQVSTICMLLRWQLGKWETSSHLFPVVWSHPENTRHLQL